MKGVRQDAFERFLERIAVDEQGCWLWLGAVNSSGYGQIRIDGRAVYTHRFSYEQHVGPIPAGLQLDHLCRVRRCANPDHLEPVTFAVNVGRGSKPNQTHCKHGHRFTPENTYRRPDNGYRQCRACARARSNTSPALTIGR